MATPTGGAVGSATADAITVTWDAVSGASGYTIYRSTQSMAASINAPPDNLVGTYSATSTAVTGTTHTTGTLDGKTYYFFVTSTVGTVESDTNAAQASAVPFATVTSPDTNRVWMSRNLGATQGCNGSSSDTACYGDLYQWGRAADGHQRIDRTTPGNCFNAANSSESCTSLATSIRATSITATPGVNFIIDDGFGSGDWVAANVDDNGVLRSAAWADGGDNDVCPTGFSVPTLAELTADTTSASRTPVTNPETAFSSFLKLPVAGSRDSFTASLSNAGSNGLLWSRSASGSNSHNITIEQSANNTGVFDIPRSPGLSVRCIKVIAPSLADASATTATSGNAITITFNNGGGAPATCTANPDLPDGLTVDASTCTIAGTPTAVQTATIHTVTGTNTAGSDSATVSILVSIN